MHRYRNQGLFSIALGILFAIGFLAETFVFQKIFVDHDSVATEAGVTAFFGALFAVLLQGVFAIFALRRRRLVMHYNALVKLQGLLNENMNLLADNKAIIRPFIQAIRDGRFYSSELEDPEIPTDVISNLANLKFINEVADYAHALRKYRGDSKTVQRTYQEIKDARVRGVINEDVYKLNAEHLSSQLLTLHLAHTERLIEVTRRLAAITVLLMEKETVSPSRVMNLFAGAYDYCEDEVVLARKRVETDIETTGKASRSEIVEMSKRAIEIARELSLEEPRDSRALVSENPDTT